MSVVIETTLGDITVDLFLKERPRACLNFLKLCKMKYYNYNLFHTISRGFIAQTGDPTGSRQNGESIYGVLEGPSKRYFEGEKNPRIKHTHMGLVSFVGNGEGMIGSQFFVTLGSDLTYLDGKHCVFGEVMEGLDVIELLNETICDSDNRPYKDVRITHTVVLDDPFNDLKGMQIPSRSPSPTPERLQGGRIGADEEIDDTEGKTAQEISEMLAEREAKARATILEMVGDLPDAEMAPPENVLFVCKLNPVTTDDDLEIIFSRFGKIVSCEVIRDRKSGDSLQYAFVEFDNNKSCEDAYFKMDNVLIDDRRIHVDFSQSVSKIKWHGKGRGVTHYDDRGRKVENTKYDFGSNKNLKQSKTRRDDSRRNAIDRRSDARERSPYQNRSCTSDRRKHESSPSHRRGSPQKTRRDRSRSPLTDRRRRHDSPYNNKRDVSPKFNRNRRGRSPNDKDQNERNNKYNSRNRSPYYHRDGSHNSERRRRNEYHLDRNYDEYERNKKRDEYQTERDRYQADRNRKHDEHQKERDRNPDKHQIERNRNSDKHQVERDRNPDKYQVDKQMNKHRKHDEHETERKQDGYDKNRRNQSPDSQTNRRSEKQQSIEESNVYKNSETRRVESSSSEEEKKASKKKQRKTETSEDDSSSSSGDDRKKKRKKKNKKKSKRRKDSSSESESSSEEDRKVKKMKKKRKRKRGSSSSD